MSPPARIVRGLSLSWEPAVATIYLGLAVPKVVWSPCSKFIAVTARESIEVLDAVTLNRLAAFKHCPDHGHFGFSPDSRSLTLFTPSKLISWDIQTGGCQSEILPKPGEQFTVAASSTYSKSGKMVAVACFLANSSRFKVYTFDLPSRTCLGSLSTGKLVTPIWTHDEYLRLAIIHPGSITIWEVEFTLKHPPTQVESFPIPDEVVDGKNFLFLPVLHRLAFTLNDTVQVRDVKASKLLLKSKYSHYSQTYSFSSDGHFFTSAVINGEFHVWKESPAGYALHQQPPFLFDGLEPPFLSPNGRSIIFSLGSTINLWHTGDQTFSPPSPPTEEESYFLLAFSPNEKSAAFTQSETNVVTILDLPSGNLRLTIDTGMKVKGLGVTEGTVVVVDEGKIVTWNLPGGGRAFNASINDSVWTVMFEGCSFDFLSLSTDLSQIAGLGLHKQGVGYGLGIYDVSTGKLLASTESNWFYQPWFDRDEREVWTKTDNFGGGPQGDGWEIIKGSVSGAMELKPLEETLYPSRTFLWHSILGYQVTDDGWVLSPTRKRLLWLPHRWRSIQEYRLWSRRYLGLSHGQSEVVILEFLE